MKRRARNPFPGVSRVVDRHGKTRWRFRMKGRAPCYLAGEYGSAEFRAAYEAAVKADPSMPPIPRAEHGSFDWLIEHYMRTPKWQKLAKISQYNLRHEFERFRVDYGKRQVKTLQPVHVEALLAKKAHQPTMANRLLKLLRRLIRFAIKKGIRTDDPTIGVERYAENPDGFYTHPLRSDMLCQLLSQPEIQVRVLGRSELQKIPSTALVAATGNNLSIHGDLNRRTIRIRLDAACERPDERSFGFDPVSVAERLRAELVTAALTIVRAYMLAGLPQRAAAMGSFEDWSDHVRSALMWINMPDPRGDQAEVASEDPERVELGEIIDALPDAPFSAKEVRRRVGEDPDLRQSLARFIDRTGAFNATKFGHYLRRYRNTPVAGRAIQLARADNSHGSTWFVGALAND
jgi:hypothetical protein